jgi:hypothetical protein
VRRLDGLDDQGVLEPNFTYESVIETSERVAWKIADLFPDGTRISFDAPHLPDALAGVECISGLDDRAKLTLNHIRGHSYMNLFAFVEEYIIAQTVKHAEAEMFGDHDAVRALLRFGEEELKHQKLFQTYCAAFRRDFGSEVRVLSAASDVASVILSHSPTAVLITTLHLEIMTQQHFVKCFKDDPSADPLFSNILKHHWIEEAQHVKIDLLELAKLVEESSEEQIDSAIEEYFGILTAFDGLLADQVEMDIESLEVATGSALGPVADEVRAAQRRSYRNDFLVMGMSNPMFISTVRALLTSGKERLDVETNKYRS